jgi:hypothetical protein
MHRKASLPGRILLNHELILLRAIVTREHLKNPRTDSAETQKVIRLLDYLTRLASLRSKIVRNIDEYQNILWVKDIPQQKGSICMVLRPLRNG